MPQAEKGGSRQRPWISVARLGLTAGPGAGITYESQVVAFERQFSARDYLLTRSGPSRVVNVTSALYRFGRVPWEQLETSGGDGVSVEYPGVESTYASSKLLLNLFSVHLARQLQGTEVTCNAVHPGVVATTINQKEPGLRHFLWNSFLHTFGTSPRKGARGSVYLSSSPGLRDVTGKYFVSCRQSSWSSKVLDDETAHKVCRRSAELVRAVLADAHSARAPSSAGTAAQETASFAGLLDDHSTRRDSS
ncbi:hypothetical protein HPB49_019909 [Dermacentor silvarum]|uniref:Uncharacterized protein n=1 Tax=Dermacentor silvarum TaxID=543639 RepID=A0ACB8CH40_DERSI|nr:hypothetical protein HPB49_019909 [Dermacentor silvarum]